MLLQGELQRLQPEKSFVNEVLATFLNGLMTLAGRVIWIASVLAKARVGLS